MGKRGYGGHRAKLCAAPDWYGGNRAKLFTAPNEKVLENIEPSYEMHKIGGGGGSFRGRRARLPTALKKHLGGNRVRLFAAPSEG